MLGFGGLIFLNAGIWTARMTILDREVTKSWLNESKVYDNFVTELANLVKQDQTNRGGENPEGGFDVDALTRAAKKAFPPTTLKEDVETVLDSAYNWLEGKTDTLVFNLDFNEEKQAFIDALGVEGLARVASLPACQSGESMEEFDPFSATCLPLGADASAQIEQFKTEIASSQDVLPDTTLSNEDVKLDFGGQNKPIDEAFSNAPRIFGWLRSSPVLLAILVTINSALIVVLCRPKRSGFKILSWFFGIVGGLLLLFGGTSILLRESILERTAGGGDNGLAENILFPLIREVSSSTGKWNMIFGGIYIAVSVIFAVIYITQKKKNPEAEDIENKEPEHLAPVEEKPKESKPVPKIQ